ncbi:MAG: hypothetical protein ACREVX_16080 [Clostridium sp.]|uniref:hypothetical protein n=1 Tax=Clostridium sp. TaxID=1506 RepID=UPI003D6D6C5F
MLTSKILDFFNATMASDGQAEKIKPVANVDRSRLTNPLKNLGAESESNHLITAILNMLQLIIYVILAVVVNCLLVHLFINIKNFYKGLSMKKTYIKEKREFVVSLDDSVMQIKEKAPYNDMECSKEEVDRMRGLLK